MKKLLVLGVLAVAAGLIALGSTPAQATGPWYVNANTGNDGNDCLSSGTACKTIQAAISKASPGDTINVAAGTYDEQVLANKGGLTLVGPNAGIDPGCAGARPNAEAVVDYTGGFTGIGTASTVVIAGANNVTVDGLSIKSARTDVNQVAVLIGGNFVGETSTPSDGNTIRNNIISGGRTNVYIWESADNALKNNRATGPAETMIFVGDDDTGGGSPTRHPTGNQVLDNCLDKAAGNGTLGNGVALNHTGTAAATLDFSGTLIQGNTITDTAGTSKLFRGIDTASAHAAPANPIRILGNSVNKATENYGNGLNLKDSSNIVADGNTLDADNNRCVVVNDVQGITLSNNTITSDGASGGGSMIVQFLSGTSDVTMVGNSITVNNPATNGSVITMASVTGSVDVTKNTVEVTGSITGGGTYRHGLDITPPSTSTTSSIGGTGGSGNTFDANGVGADSVGIRLRNTLASTASLNIICNTITAWSRGIRSDDLSTGIAVAANLNSIAGNSVYGVVNGTGTGQLVDAEDNWWGDSSGPSGSGSGSGDAVSTNVDFDPWLAAPPSACAAAPQVGGIMELAAGESGSSGGPWAYYIALAGAAAAIAIAGGAWYARRRWAR